jgi:uncharacterized protein
VDFLDRGLSARINAAWSSSPVVVLEGLRATGKTTLVRQLVPATSYRDLANPVERALASADIRGWVFSLPSGTVIDEAQVVPDLQSAVKERVDREGVRPGQFLLTGSARLNTREMGGSDPLVGRAARLRLHPFAQCEILGTPRDVVAALFEEDPATWRFEPAPISDVLRRARQGGFPFRRSAVASYAVGDEQLDLYAEGLFDGDIYQSGRNSEMILRLFRWLAGRSGAMRNVADFGSKTDIDKRTVADYLDALRQVNLIEAVPGFRVDSSSRETERDRLFVADPALITNLSRATDDEVLRNTDMLNAATETFVATELLRMIGWSSERVRPFHWRENARHEVDFLLERDNGDVVGIEVKSAADVRTAHASGLRMFRDRHMKRFHRGFVIHAGDHVARLDDNIWAVPFSVLWSIGAPLGHGDHKRADSAAIQLAGAMAKVRAARSIRAVSVGDAIERVRLAMEYAIELLRALSADLVELGFDAVTIPSRADISTSVTAEPDEVIWNQEAFTRVRSPTGRAVVISVTGQVTPAEVEWTMSDGTSTTQRKSPLGADHRKVVDDLLGLLAAELPRVLDDLGRI